ncbi:MAG: hypothetical protein ACJ72F_10885 [Nitrososphaeraceae archaeon]|jgi:hypothetical protein
MTRRKRTCLFAVYSILEEQSKKYAQVKGCLNLIVQLRELRIIYSYLNFRCDGSHLQLKMRIDSNRRRRSS